MARFVTFRLCLTATVLGVLGTVATASGQAVKGVGIVRTGVGPTRLVSPRFGYSVAYRTVESGPTAHTVIGGSVTQRREAPGLRTDKFRPAVGFEPSDYARRFV